MPTEQLRHQFVRGYTSFHASQYYLVVKVDDVYKAKPSQLAVWNVVDQKLAAPDQAYAYGLQCYKFFDLKQGTLDGFAAPQTDAKQEYTQIANTGAFSLSKMSRFPSIFAELTRADYLKWSKLVERHQHQAGLRTALLARYLDEYTQFLAQVAPETANGLSKVLFGNAILGDQLDNVLRIRGVDPGHDFGPDAVTVFFKTRTLAQFDELVAFSNLVAHDHTPFDNVNANTATYLQRALALDVALDADKLASTLNLFTQDYVLQRSRREWQNLILYFAQHDPQHYPEMIKEVLQYGQQYFDNQDQYQGIATAARMLVAASCVALSGYGRARYLPQKRNKTVLDKVGEKVLVGTMWSAAATFGYNMGRVLA